MNPSNTFAINIFIEEVLLTRFDIDRAVDQLGKTCCEAFVVLDFESKTPRGCDDNDRESSVGLAGRLQKIDFINGSVEKLRDSLFYLSEGYRLYYDRVRFLFCENSETIMFLRHNPRVFARIRRNHFRIFCLE